MYLLLIAILLLIVGGFFLSAAVLNWLGKKFKINDLSFKSSLIITIEQAILSLIAGFIVGFISVAINMPILSIVIGFIIGIFIFHWLIKKYQVSLKKSFEIYICLIAINLVISVILALIISVPVRSLITQPFYVKGATMEPTLSDKDYLYINLFDKNYNHGDIVVFKYPQDPMQFFIKRIIGLPGDQVKIQDNNVYINGVKLDESYLPSSTLTELPLRGFGDVKLGTDEYFVLGDNRSSSLDSRIFGPLPKYMIVGRIWFELFPKFKEFK